MAKISRGKFRWLRDEYAFRQWRKWFIADVGRTLSELKVGDLVQDVATRGYYEGCKKLDTGFDMETLIHTSVMENPTHLTIHRGRHRHPPVDHQRVYKVISIESVQETL